jgi:dolichol-phosphate mannosyltransferase
MSTVAGTLRAAVSRTSNQAIGRATVFGLVGVSGLAVNSALLWFLAEPAGIGYLVAAALATQGSTTWNFLLAERLVFGGRRYPGAGRRFVSFAVMNNIAMVLRLPLLALLTTTLGIHYLISNVLTLIVLFIARFLLSDRLIWRQREPADGIGQVDVAPPASLTP